MVLGSTVCESISHTQVVIEEVEEHQHAAAHDHKHADHDGGDVNRLFVLLLCGLVPLQLKVAPGGKPNTDHAAVHQRYLPSAAQLAGHSPFLSTAQNTHTQSMPPKMFSARGPVRHGPRLTVPSLWRSVREDGLGRNNTD